MGESALVRKSILVVEDNFNFCEALRLALKDRYAVVAVDSARAAREELRKGPPALVLLDFRLPDGTGLDLLREIKAGHPSVPVILLTAYGSEELLLQAFRAGVRDYFRKPFRLQDLLGRITRLLEVAASNQERRTVAELPPTPVPSEDKPETPPPRKPRIPFLGPAS